MCDLHNLLDDSECALSSVKRYSMQPTYMRGNQYSF